MKRTLIGFGVLLLAVAASAALIFATPADVAPVYDDGELLAWIEVDTAATCESEGAALGTIPEVAYIYCRHRCIQSCAPAMCVNFKVWGSLPHLKCGGFECLL